MLSTSKKSSLKTTPRLSATWLVTPLTSRNSSAATTDRICPFPCTSSTSTSKKPFKSLSQIKFNTYLLNYNKYHFSRNFITLATFETSVIKWNNRSAMFSNTISNKRKNKNPPLSLFFRSCLCWQHLKCQNNVQIGCLNYVI